MKEKIEIIFIVAAVSSVLPLAAGLFNFRRLTTPLKYLLSYSALCCLMEAVNAYVIYYLKRPTFLLFHVFTVAELLLLSTVFLLWFESRRINKAIPYILALYVVFWLLAQQIIKSQTFDSLIVTIEAVILVGLGVTSLLHLALHDSGFLLGSPRFWVSSGVLLYFAGNLIVFALGSQLLQHEEARMIWRFHTALNILSYLFYMTGYLCLGRFRS